MKLSNLDLVLGLRRMWHDQTRMFIQAAPGIMTTTLLIAGYGQFYPADLHIIANRIPGVQQVKTLMEISQNDTSKVAPEYLADEVERTERVQQKLDILTPNHPAYLFNRTQLRAKDPVYFAHLRVEMQKDGIQKPDLDGLAPLSNLAKPGFCTKADIETAPNKDVYAIIAMGTDPHLKHDELLKMLLAVKDETALTPTALNHRKDLLDFIAYHEVLGHAMDFYSKDYQQFSDSTHQRAMMELRADIFAMVEYAVEHGNIDLPMQFAALREMNSQHQLDGLKKRAPVSSFLERHSNGRFLGLSHYNHGKEFATAGEEFRPTLKDKQAMARLKQDPQLRYALAVKIFNVVRPSVAEMEQNFKDLDVITALPQKITPQQAASLSPRQRARLELADKAGKYYIQDYTPRLPVPARKPAPAQPSVS